MATESTISLKLLVDKTSERVIFAEAGKDFVDFLFGLLELPLGSLIRLLAQEGMAASWSFGKVYESVKNLDDDYIQTEQTKQILLAPKLSSNTKGTTHLMQKLGYGKPEPSSSSVFESSSPSLFGSYSSSPFSSSIPAFGSSSSTAFGSSSPSPFGSSSSSRFGSSPFSSSCIPAFSSPAFGSSSSSPFGSSSPSPFGSSSSSPSGSSRDDNRKKEMGGYVKGIVTYMILDDLTVKAGSPISSVSLISSLGVTDIGSLEEKNVEINMEKALELVKTSFESSTVLTDVFVRNIKTGFGAGEYDL